MINDDSEEDGKDLSGYITSMTSHLCTELEKDIHMQIHKVHINVPMSDLGWMGFPPYPVNPLSLKDMGHG